MEPFQIFSNPHLIAEAGALNARLLPLLLSAGHRRLCLVQSASVASLPQVHSFAEQLHRALSLTVFTVSGEPDVRSLDPLIESARAVSPDGVVAIGGGSVLDTAKAIGFMVREEGSLADFLEGVGDKRPSGAKIPFYAVPTTAGTGSEATQNGVVFAETKGERVKKSFRHEKLPAETAVLDPELTLSLPFRPTAASAMDAVTQLLEAYVSTGGNPFTCALAESGLSLIGVSFDLALTDPADLAARGDLLYASYLSGLCLSNAGLGAVHGMAAPVGAAASVPHGVVCALLLPEVTDCLLHHLIQQAHLGGDQFPYLIRYARAGYLLNNESDAFFDLSEGCVKLMHRLNEWKDRIKMGTLADYGFTEDRVEAVAARCGVKNSPVSLTRQDFSALLRRCGGWESSSGA